MPNGNELGSELDFEVKIKGFTPEGQFLARQLYQTCETLEDHHVRIKTLENYNKKAFGFTSGISAILGGVIIAVVNYFVNK